MHVPAALAVLILAGIGALVYLRTRRRPGDADLGRLSDSAFEQYLADLFARLGFEVGRFERGNDFGADLILARNGARMAVQAKAQKDEAGIAAVQQALGARFFYGTGSALAVTTGVFSTAARELAARADVVLWERDDVLAAAAHAGVGSYAPG